MKYLRWNDSYSVGIDAVDFEHQTLIEMINMIYAELDDRRDIDEIRRTVADVHTEISAHFALEERIMRDGHYDEYEAHKNDHEELLDQIRTMMDAIENDGEAALEMLSEQLADWFSAHFATFDARMHSKFGPSH
ncbi:MAG: bacteriohemerythrin [Gammaproteobacteria bacterium]|nr:bacteriohemerythrin [Gammaproteobacteria bacterium]